MILLSWLCYYLGCFACWILELNHESEKWADFWYPVYNYFMLKSVDLQGKNPRGPWNFP